MDVSSMGALNIRALNIGILGMVNPGLPIPEPLPGSIPGDLPTPPLPDEQPDIGPTGPRTPYPVNDPGIGEPTGPGSEPDYLPGGPTDPGVRM